MDGEILGQPLKWWGGKHYLAKRIIALMPRHLHYVEPFAGGLAVLLEKNPFETSHYWGEKGYEQGISEVANDIHQELINFWRVLQGEDTFAKFRRRIEATPFSQVEWEEAEARQIPRRSRCRSRRGVFHPVPSKPRRRV